eukprot:scaffold72837_cov20-Prasinocladus_malaysianus.AAC.2
MKELHIHRLADPGLQSNRRVKPRRLLALLTAETIPVLPEIYPADPQHITAPNIHHVVKVLKRGLV